MVWFSNRQIGFIKKYEQLLLGIRIVFSTNNNFISLSVRYDFSTRKTQQKPKLK